MPMVMGLHSYPLRKPGGRIGNRLRLGVPAVLTLTHDKRDCLIDDISATGVRVRAQPPMAIGQTAMLTFHELRLLTTAIWSRDGECGLRFDRPLDLEDMQGMLWIKQNRKLYDRLCNEDGARDWATGIGGD